MTRELLKFDQITAEKITLNGETITASIAKYDGLNAIFTIIYNDDTAPTSRAVASTTGDTESARRQGDRLLYYMNGGRKPRRNATTHGAKVI